MLYRLLDPDRDAHLRLGAVALLLFVVTFVTTPARVLRDPP
jgi:hypothetical protein